MDGRQEDKKVNSTVAKTAVFWVLRYNPEDSHLRTHRRENLKSY
jgi:hypothetical protein